MGLDHLMSLLRGDHQLERLSQEVAQRCASQVWERAGLRALELPAAEARGYIRARSGLLLAAESRQVLAAQRSVVVGVKPQRLIAAAGDLVVQQVMRRMQEVRVAQREAARPAKAA